MSTPDDHTPPEAIDLDREVNQPTPAAPEGPVAEVDAGAEPEPAERTQGAESPPVEVANAPAAAPAPEPDQSEPQNAIESPNAVANEASTSAPEADAAGRQGPEERSLSAEPPIPEAAEAPEPEASESSVAGVAGEAATKPGTGPAESGSSESKTEQPEDARQAESAHAEGPRPEGVDPESSLVAAGDVSDLPDVTSDEALEAALEALLLVVDSPASEETLADTVEQPVARVTVALRTMAQKFTERASGIDLRRVGEGWRFYTRDTYAPFVEKLLLDGQRSKLTRAALESLAVIAYRQPVTRARVAAVRGVNVDGVIRTLLARGLIEEMGTDPETTGTLYVTTELFLERLGLSSLNDLPPIAPLLPEVDTIDDI